jgi:hypothetical protein
MRRFVPVEIGDEPILSKKCLRTEAASEDELE